MRSVFVEIVGTEHNGLLYTRQFGRDKPVVGIGQIIVGGRRIEHIAVECSKALAARMGGKARINARKVGNRTLFAILRGVENDVGKRLSLVLIIKVILVNKARIAGLVAINKCPLADVVDGPWCIVFKVVDNLFYLRRCRPRKLILARCCGDFEIFGLHQLRIVLHNKGLNAVVAVVGIARSRNIYLNLQAVALVDRGGSVGKCKLMVAQLREHFGNVAVGNHLPAHGYLQAIGR